MAAKLTTDQIIQQVFQQYLGRDVNPNELQGFRSAINGGRIDPMGLSLIVTGSQEYMKNQAPKVAQQYSDALGNSDDAYMRHSLQVGGDQAASTFRQLGRPVSSGFDQALATQYGNVSRDLAMRRQQYTAGAIAPYYNPAPYQSAGLGTYQQSLQRKYANEDYTRSAADYASYFGKAQSQAESNQWAQLGGAALGAAGTAYGGYASNPMH